MFNNRQGGVQRADPNAVTFIKSPQSDKSTTAWWTQRLDTDTNYSTVNDRQQTTETHWLYIHKGRDKQETTHSWTRLMITRHNAWWEIKSMTRTTGRNTRVAWCPQVVSQGASNREWHCDLAQDFRVTGHDITLEKITLVDVNNAGPEDLSASVF